MRIGRPLVARDRAGSLWLGVLVIFAARVSEDPKHQARLYCEIVAQLVIADGQVTDEERDLLIRLMDRFGFDDADRAAVFNSVDYGAPITDRLAALDEPMRRDLLVELEAAAMVDGEIGPAEAQILDEARKAIE